MRPPKNTAPPGRSAVGVAAAGAAAGLAGVLLSRGPVTGIESVTYFDLDEVEQTLSASASANSLARAEVMLLPGENREMSFR